MSEMKKMRQAAGLSLAALAKKSGIPVATVKGIELGKCNVTFNMLGQLSGAMEVPEIDIVYATGSKIRIMRADSGLTQQGMSDMCNISRSMLSAIELGERDPSPEMMKDMASALGVAPRDVLDAVMSERGL